MKPSELRGVHSGLTTRLRQLAKDQGFAHLGVAPAVTPTGFHRLLEWVASGYDAGMSWISRRSEAYRHPDGVMPGTRSVIMVAMNYHDGTPPFTGPRIARYAAGSRDYHQVIRERLQPLADLIKGESPNAKTRIVVDTAPLLERDFGRLAGLGWIGKNTMLISRSIGSWFFLGAILTNIEMEWDEPLEHDYCGSCTRCLAACPTDAFPEPGVLDARRCISYLTIEQRNDGISEDLRHGIGEWIFGCDVCQDVCPWNRFAPEETVPELRSKPALTLNDCRQLLSITPEQFEEQFEGTPMQRTGRAAILRNVAIVLGNLRDSESRDALEEACRHVEPLVREAACWALQQIDSADL